MTDSLRTYRDIFSFALLGVVAATLLATFIALLDDRTLDGTLSAAWVLVVVLAVVIAAPRKDDLSPHARLITIAALSILGVGVVLGLWGFFSMLATDLLQGKATLAIAQLATLALNALAIFAGVRVLGALPAPVRQQQPSWGGQQQGQGQWGQQPAQQQGQWGQQPAQQWGDQGSWQQGAQQAPQAPSQQSWQPYAAGAAGVAGYAAAEGAQQVSWNQPQHAAPQHAAQPTPEQQAPQQDPAGIEPAEQSTAVWTPPVEQPAADPWAAQQPEQSGWGTQQDSAWGRDNGWAQPAQPTQNAWGQEATEQPTWQPATEYGSTWSQPAPQQPYGAAEQPAPSWETPAPSTRWGASETEAEQPYARFGNATFDPPPAEAPVDPAAGASAGEAAPAGAETAEQSGSGTDDDGGDDSRATSWWSPGSPS
ncbi:hypothetical protein FE697_014990 [Mumia zhuanghuii]|uniref:Uncharacterized protein n=2 Tax=Mumia TaxID=1546255 RepID=A0ABW1QTJ4_9ACTN|nr:MULTISPECIES: hypothetical protein [Mumia]KAA1422448.1 hypothetical protein FE697_014990 [Mumia zhuanghuii]